jgi:hypothetical protein
VASGVLGEPNKSESSPIEQEKETLKRTKAHYLETEMMERSRSP